MTKEEHLKRHKLLHEQFDELLGDFMTHNEDQDSYSPIYELLKWSYKQTLNPTEIPDMDEDIKKVLRHANNENYDIAPFVGGPGIVNWKHGGLVTKIKEETLEKMHEQGLVDKKPNGKSWQYNFTYEGRRLGAKLHYNL